MDRTDKTEVVEAVGTGRGAELGVLMKGGAVLEAASRVDRVLLDNTGTLTAGKPTLTDVITTSGERVDDLLTLVDGVLEGLVAVADLPLPAAMEALAELREMGIGVAMLTGDRATTARSVASTMGIPEVKAELDPEQKARIVSGERGSGRRCDRRGRHRPHGRWNRSARNSIEASARDAENDSPEPVLGLRLQRGRHSRRCRGSLPVDRVAPVAGARERRHVAFQRVGSSQLASFATIRTTESVIVFRRRADGIA